MRDLKEPPLHSTYVSWVKQGDEMAGLERREGSAGA